MTNKPLFEPYDLGGLRLANRVVMAPPTRNRTSAQHADLIITQPLQTLKPSKVSGPRIGATSICISPIGG